MAKTKKEANTIKHFGKFERGLVSTLVFRSHRPFCLEDKAIEKAFTEVSSSFPKMTEVKWPDKSGKDDDDTCYHLFENNTSDPERWMRSIKIYNKRLMVGISFPLKLEEQIKNLQKLLNILEHFNFLSAIGLDIAELTSAFGFRYDGNHHKEIIDLFFKNSFLYQILKETGGEPTLFNPEIYICHPKDKSLRFIIDIQPSTSFQEIETGRYDNDSIIVLCKVVKRSDFSTKATLGSLFGLLCKESLRFAGTFTENVLVKFAGLPQE